MNVFRKSLLFGIALTLLCVSPKTFAQTTVVSTIPLGHAPNSLAINPQTNIMYAADRAGYRISVVDGATNMVTSRISLTFQPEGVSINPTTNRLYVTGSYFDGVVVFDATTSAITARIPVAPWMTEIEVNSVTNQVYVGNPVDRSITVIDGQPGSSTENTVVAVIPLPVYGGGDIAVNEVTNRIYVGTAGYDFQTNKYIPITVIDGSTNTIVAQPLLDELGGGVAVNPKTNIIYSTSGASYRLLAIDGNTYSVLANIWLDEHAYRVAVNPRTNRIHLTNGFGGSLITIDGATYTYLSRLWLGTYDPIPIYIGVNPLTSYVYTGNIGFNSDFGGQSISVIDDPPPPGEQIRELIDLVKAFNLSQGIANSLDTKLQRALEALDSVNNGNSPTACNKLSSFINEVEVQQQLSPAQATQLMNAATRIMRTLGCG
jgi:DNA-binding beta-propeller fold protein YncE